MRSLLCSLLLTLPAFAVDPPVSPIRLPNVRDVTPPLPMPADAAVKLIPGYRYVVESDVECLVFLSPGGSVSLKKQHGPITIDAKFVDGTGENEERDYKSKFIYSFKAIKVGRDELIIMPVGAKAESEAKRVTFQVGQLPIPPPPGPNPPGPQPPGPTPDPTPVPVTSFRVIFVYESLTTLPAKQTSILYAKSIADYLTEKTTAEGGLAGWRRFDKDAGTANDQPVMRALWAAVKPKITTVPCMIIETNGKADILPWPASVDEALATLKKAGG